MKYKLKIHIIVKIKTIILMTVIGLLTSCNTTEKKVENPLLTDYTTPMGVPPFEQIKNEHYVPAFNKGIEEQNAEIKAIVENTDAPSFENTVLALEYTGQTIQKVEDVFGNLLSANTNDKLQAIAKEIFPKLSKHQDEILLNEHLFAKVKAVYEQKEQLTLSTEEAKLLDETFKHFVRRGANLPNDQKEELKNINSELSLLSLQFGENILAETNNYKLVIDNKADLAGLPESSINAAAEASEKEGEWVFTLQKPSWVPFLQYAKNRDLREKLYKAMYSRGDNNNENDNKEIIKNILTLRTRRAQIMGFENHAQYELDDRMAKKPEKVYDLLNQLWTPALKIAKNEAKDLQSMIDKEGGNFKLKSWDWWYYSEKVKMDKYALEDSETRPYFELNNVRDGAFLLAHKLWGIQFSEMKNIPVPHPDAKAFEVKEADGTLIGLLYVDYYARESKKGGAWMSSYRKQKQTIDGKNVMPIITNVCNFSKPAANQPALLSFDEVTTIFHEFGHAMHGMLSNCRFQSLSGTSVPRDFVELPSQLMENWCIQPEMLKLFAKHYKTGEVIPQSLINKLVAASKFNQGFATVEYLAASFLDMDYHTLTNITDLNIDEFETNKMNERGLIDEIIPRYKSTYFSHIWSGGYSAGYYSYIWAEVLDADAFAAYVESGDIFNHDIATSYRKNIISKGGTEDAMEMYIKFRGQAPSIEPLLEKRGLK